MSGATRVVLVKPGDVLIFGNVGDVMPSVDENLHDLKEALGLAHIVVFAGDIDLAALDPAAYPDAMARTLGIDPESTP